MLTRNRGFEDLNRGVLRPTDQAAIGGHGNGGSDFIATSSGQQAQDRHLGSLARPRPACATNEQRASPRMPHERSARTGEVDRLVVLGSRRVHAHLLLQNRMRARIEVEAVGAPGRRHRLVREQAFEGSEFSGPGVP